MPEPKMGTIEKKNGYATHEEVHHRVRPKITTSDLMERMQAEEARARQIKKNAAEKDAEKEMYWEGYVVALRKAQELVREYNIVKKWVG